MATSRILYYGSQIIHNQSDYVDIVVYAKDYFRMFKNMNASFILNYKWFCSLFKKTNMWNFV